MFGKLAGINHQSGAERKPRLGEDKEEKEALKPAHCQPGKALAATYPPYTHFVPTLYPPRLIPGGQSKPSSPGEWAQPSPNDTSPDLPQLKASRKQLESHCAQPGQWCTGRRTEVPHDGSSPAHSLSLLVTIIPKEEENLGL